MSAKTSVFCGVNATASGRYQNCLRKTHGKRNQIVQIREEYNYHSCSFARLTFSCFRQSKSRVDRWKIHKYALETVCESAKNSPNRYQQEPATSAPKAPPNPPAPMTDNYTPDQQRALRRAEALAWEIERANHALDVEKRLAEEARTRGVTTADMNYGKKEPAKDAPENPQKEGQK